MVSDGHAEWLLDAAAKATAHGVDRVGVVKAAMALSVSSSRAAPRCDDGRYGARCG
jgi:hypothetical protein